MWKFILLLTWDTKVFALTSFFCTLYLLIYTQREEKWRATRLKMWERSRAVFVYDFILLCRLIGSQESFLHKFISLLLAQSSVFCPNMLYFPELYFYIPYPYIYLSWCCTGYCSASFCTSFCLTLLAQQFVFPQHFFLSLINLHFTFVFYFVTCAITSILNLLLPTPHFLLILSYRLFVFVFTYLCHLVYYIFCPFSCII